MWINFVCTEVETWKYNSKKKCLCGGVYYSHNKAVFNTLVLSAAPRYRQTGGAPGGPKYRELILTGPIGWIMQAVKLQKGRGVTCQPEGQQRPPPPPSTASNNVLPFHRERGRGSSRWRSCLPAQESHCLFPTCSAKQSSPLLARRWIDAHNLMRDLSTSCWHDRKCKFQLPPIIVFAQSVPPQYKDFVGMCFSFDGEDSWQSEVHMYYSLSSKKYVPTLTCWAISCFS